MKKLLSLLIVVMAAAQVLAAPVDVATAQTKAEQYLVSKVYAGKIMSPGATHAQLIKTEMGDNATTPVYYIFNTATTFVIVSGDDRAEEILAVGDRPLNLDRIPCNMQAWLDSYKHQLDWLLSHPEVKVEKPTTYKSPLVKDAGRVYGPLMTALWDQTAPFNDQCYFTYGGTTYECYTGCPATSASMILYYWKYPTEQVGPIPAYTSTLDLGDWNSVGYTYPALPAVTFDWDNMLDDYTGDYTPEQGAAVATLMRYVGQCEHMMYGTYEAGGSGIYTTDTQIIADMYIGFGYDETTCRFVRKSNYSESQWAGMLQQEIIENRPVVFCGVDTGGAGGHAFNVDGYDPNLNKYHVNFGWSGDGNNWYVMNAFSYSGYTFSDNQRMVLGIQPPMGVITASPSQVSFDGFAGETYTRTVRVQARNIENNITLALSGSQLYSVNTTTITPEQASTGYDVTVTYTPAEAGSSEASLILSCADEDVETVAVPIAGVAKPRVPTLLVEPQSLHFNAVLSQSVTKTFRVTGAFITGDMTLTLADNNGVFTVSPTTISQSSTDVNTPVEVTVTFNSANEGNFSGALVIASEGAESVTVALTAKANNGGTASDPYLDIAKYETIDEAGWNTSDIQHLYNYTERESDECAWLTVSNYGVLKADATQNWFTNVGTRTGSESWNATDVFLGSAHYFDGDAYYTDWSEDYQTFYVTNCTQVKQYAENRSSTNYPLKMEIYECTLNADGSITASPTAVQIKQSVTASKEVVASDELDPSKIYKIAIYNDYSKLYEIGFKTSLNNIETPVATEATQVTADGFTANWTFSPSATSYTLRVMPKPDASLLMSEGFANCTSAGAIDVGDNLDNYLDNPGWTGSKLYTVVGGLRLGTGTYTGSLISPCLDLASDNKVSVRIKAQTFNNDTDCGLKISCGNASETITVPNNSEDIYTVVLDCTAHDQNVKLETVAKAKRVVITGVEFYSGDITSQAEKGFDETIISGITDLKYAVTGLLPATTYLFDVRAVNGNMQGLWSNKIEVTTLAGGNQVYGDVNGDGEVTAVDITCLYNYLLTGDTTYLATSDVNGDGEITSVDITVIYNILLGN